MIQRQGREFLLRDAGSWRGTKVNDMPVTQWILKNGDEIQIGGARMIFRCEAESSSVGPAPRPVIERQTMVTPPPKRAPKGEAVEALRDAVTPREEEEPIRAGGSEDFIEPSAPPGPQTVREEESVPAAQVIAATPAPVVVETPEDGAPRKAEVVELAPEAAAEARAEQPPPRAEVVPISGGTAHGKSDSRRAPEPLDEIQLWEKALKNRSAAIRKQAAKMLKKLTGKDYEY